MKYMLKRFLVDAVQWRGESLEQMIELVGEQNVAITFFNRLNIRTNDRILHADMMDYVVRDDEGNVFIVPKEDFEREYIRDDDSIQ